MQKAQQMTPDTIDVSSVVAKVGEAITKFIFKIDGCLKISERASSLEIAKMRAERMWPRSTVEYVGEEFSHMVEDSVLSRTPPSTSTKKAKAYSSHRVAAQPTVVENLSIEERMEKTVAETFGGLA